MHEPILNMKTVIPAVIPRSAAHLADALKIISFSIGVQIDLVDGIFASPASWPYEPYGSVHDVAEALAPFDVEMDLMVSHPLEAAKAWFAVGVQNFVFHLESIDNIEHVKAFKDESACTVGFSISNDTPLDVLTEQIEFCDFVQLMGIAEIGAQAQPFDDRVLMRIQRLRTAYPELYISIDGSVNENTLPRLSGAGANRFIAGSAIINAADPDLAYATLVSLLQ